MKRIYFDNCAANRPFDSLEQERVNLEANATIAIMKRCEDEDLLLITSDILSFEITEIKDTDRKEKVEQFLSVHREHIFRSEEITIRAKYFETAAGIGAKDALHLAFAEKGKVDYFLTVDDSLYTKSQALNLDFVVLNPVDFFRQAAV